MNTSLMPPGLVVVSARIGRVGQSCAEAEDIARKIPASIKRIATSRRE
jgi:hypothetical protein